MIRRTVPLLAAIIGTLVAFGVATAPAAAAKHRRPTQSVYWGGTFGGGAPYTWGPISRFEASVGKPLSLVGLGAPFADCGSGPCTFDGFPSSGAQAVRNHGAIPFVSWSSIPTAGSAAAFSDRAVASGRYDLAIRRFAQEAKAWGHPFFLRFDWEMNGNWWAWGVNDSVNKNKPAYFVALWRHVHNIFSQVGVHNATWVWCPNVDPDHYYPSLSKLYPGNSYVDWTCLDGYNWGSTGPHSPGASRGGWQSFGRLFRSTYNEVAHHVAPSKPMILGEVSSSVNGGSQANWIRSMFKALPGSYPKVHGFLWYDVNDQWHFPVRSGTSAAHAFASGLRSRYYARNVFCRLGAPIRPPSYPAPRSPFCARG